MCDDLIEYNSYSYLELFQLYYSYRIIYEFCTEPFTNVDSQTIIQAASMMMKKINKGQPPPKGISIVKILIALSKHAMNVGAFKTVKIAHKMLRRLKLTQEFQEEFEITMMTIHVRYTWKTFYFVHQIDIAKLFYIVPS